MKNATKEWVRKAETDFRLAKELLESQKRYPDQICFHCQQAAEKYLKAALEENGLSVPKTHDCEFLLTIVRQQSIPVKLSRRSLAYISGFAVVTRYPGENATARQSRSTFRIAVRIRSVIRQYLVLKGR